MPFYEIVYETGNHSIAEYNDDTEAQTALEAHQARAKNGEPATPESTERTDTGPMPAGPTEWPAERIAKVYKFDSHPADYQADQQVSADTLTQNIDALKSESGSVDAAQAAAMVRNAASPFAQPEAPHDSDYAMEHTELQWENV